MKNNIEFRKHLNFGKKWKGLTSRTTKYYHDLVEPSKEHYDRLKELFETIPELTYDNTGYDTPHWLQKSHPEQLKEISDILQDSMLGFCEFNHFKVRKNGDVVIRMQYLWDGSFKGVGYIDLEYWNPLVHSSMYIYHQEILNENSSVDEKRAWIQGLNMSGFAGILSNGNIVDRREFNEAIPIQANKMLGVVEPKELEDGKKED